jgi:O-methyltransferase
MSLGFRVPSVPLKDMFKSALNKAGYVLINIKHPTDAENVLPPDFSEADKSLYFQVRPYTMTTPARVIALARSLEYLSAHDIRGAAVECGVYKGGSMMAIALTLQKLQDRRDLYLYDTFEGMTAPTKEDDAWTHDHWQQNQRGDHNEWVYSSLDEVKKNLASTGYPDDQLHFVKGRVEDTIPATVPEEIALLRLDTDFYASTKHELVHLFPRLKKGGVLIIDDYGSFRGSRQATDEYMTEHKLPMLLTRIDSDSRLAIKQ